MLASGDVFSLNQLVTLAGTHLDANLTGETKRYAGLTLKVRVGYSEPQHYDYYLSKNDLMTKEVGSGLGLGSGLGSGSGSGLGVGLGLPRILTPTRIEPQP